MDLNLPIEDEITTCRNLLIAGMGGGFDIFCSALLPELSRSETYGDGLLALAACRERVPRRAPARIPLP